MQNLLVLLIIMVVGVLIGRRIWYSLHHPDTVSCACGCSGCGASARCPDTKVSSFPEIDP